MSYTQVHQISSANWLLSFWNLTDSFHQGSLRHQSFPHFHPTARKNFRLQDSFIYCPTALPFATQRWPTNVFCGEYFSSGWSQPTRNKIMSIMFIGESGSTYQARSNSLPFSRSPIQQRWRNLLWASIIWVIFFFISFIKNVNLAKNTKTSLLYFILSVKSWKTNSKDAWHVTTVGQLMKWLVA